MSRIFRIPKQASIIQSLEYILQQAKEGEFTDFMFAAKLSNGEIATSWNGDLGTRQELIAHAQMDVIMGVIEVNFVTPE